MIRWKGPKVGARRSVKRFAWFPTQLDDGKVVWLEPYLSHEEFCRGYDRLKWKVWKREKYDPHGA